MTTYPDLSAPAGTVPAQQTAASMTELIEGRKPGHTLEAPFYLDPAFHRLDLREIFGKSWIFIGAEAEIPEPGDYITIDLDTTALILIRDDDEEVQALHNVCRHRGSRLLHEASGSVGNIVCGYHQWTYSPDGTLLHAGEQPSDFDKSCHSLKKAHVRCVGGLIFVCLAANPPEDFDELIPTIEPYLLPHGLTNTKVAAQVDLVEHANWKLVMENNRECYHCEAGHPELTCTFFPTWGMELKDVPARLMPAHARFLKAESDLQARCRERGIPYEGLRDLSGRATGYMIGREALDGAGESYTRDGSKACSTLLGDFDDPKMGRMTLHMQPNMWAHALADHTVIFAVFPQSPGATLVRTTWLVHADAQEGVDYDLENLTEVWVATNEQDAAFTTRTQIGVNSPAYVPGPYAPSEYQVDAFVTWYIERLKEGIAS